MRNNKIIFIQNPKLDYLFGIIGGEPIPPKHDQFKPIAGYSIDENGDEKILTNLYEKKPGKNAVIEFETKLKTIASGYFDENNIIKKPDKVEVILSINIQKDRYYNVDIDNLSKSVLDGLKGIAFEDDSLVASLIVKKNIHPLNINGIFIGITKIRPDNLGFGEGIKLYTDKK